MRIVISQIPIAISLCWQEATARSTLKLLSKVLRTKEGLFLKHDQLAGVGIAEDRGALALAPMVARAIGDGLAVVHIDSIQLARCYSSLEMFCPSMAK